MADTSQMTRYEKVKEILDRAAADSKVDYDGYGRFWRLPLDKFLDFELRGIRMIAAAEIPVQSCCHGGNMETGKSRSARSGLILGLRGQAPFDGSQLPRLPWGGKSVPDDEISFVADWIDDGCRESDRQTSINIETFTSTRSLEQIDPNQIEESVRTFAVHDASANEYSFKYGEIKQRVNLDCMNESQLEKLRWAFRELYRFNKWPEDRRSYNNMALIHQNHCQHGWERFLPWHRIYLYEFEQGLQDVCPGVTLPYWDFTMPRYCPERPENGEIIPNSFKAFLTEASITYLQTAEPPLPEDVAQKLLKEMVQPQPQRLYTSASTFFAEVAKLIDEKYTIGKHRDRFIDALLATNALWYPLRYPAEYHNKKNEPQKVTERFHYHYPTAGDIAQILALRTFRDFGGGSFYDDSFGFLDQNPHNTMHIWTGGQNPKPKPASTSTTGVAEAATDRNRGVQVTGRRFHTREDLYTSPEFGDMLSNLTASYDPIFWPIHVNIDRIWHEWQERNPHSLPKDLDAVLTPWSYTIADTLDMARFGYEYVKYAFVIPVGLGTPVGRFVSKEIAIPDNVRASFERAEVRLHRVPQLPRSCFIRLFLNLPDANGSTPIDHPNYAGYLAIFGHADCIGGPGHCDLPPSRSRQYDQRPRHHNTPRNHRIDITNAARRLFDRGATTLQLTLVVIGADYCEDKELLRLDGVSLDFLD
ncbi:MAG TPA: tyrosinase family protein [Pyrinomonadaceae bacterium]|nr:tyrosinase family protein [Pyrinomonadaceae bacterium]